MTPEVRSYLDEIKDLKAKLNICKERLEGAESYGQLAYTLSEYAKAVHEGRKAEYPMHAVAQMDLARGTAGRYQFPITHTLERAKEILRNQDEIDQDNYIKFHSMQGRKIE